MRVPLIGQGTWRMERDERKKCVATLQYGCELGMTHLDTAELYGNGSVERRIVRDVLRGRRDDIFLVSKVRPPHTRYRSVIRACERSLRRMQTDRIELYLLHWRGNTPLEETFEAFERLRSDGKIRSYGVSNFTLDDLQTAVRIAGIGRIVCNQIAYSVVNRTAEREMIPWCRKHRIAVVAYSPLGAGRFPDAESESGAVLSEIASRHRASTRQVALAYLLRQDGVFVIPKHSSKKHARDNARAAELSLSGEELSSIDAAFPIVTPRDQPLARRRRRFYSLGEAMRTLYGAVSFG